MRTYGIKNKQNIFLICYCIQFFVLFFIASTPIRYACKPSCLATKQNMKKHIFSHQGSSRKLHSPSRRNSRKLHSPRRGNSRKLHSPNRGNSRKLDSNSRGNYRKLDSPNRGNSRKLDSPSRGNSRKLHSPNRGNSRKLYTHPADATLESQT